MDSGKTEPGEPADPSPSRRGVRLSIQTKAALIATALGLLSIAITVVALELTGSTTIGVAVSAVVIVPLAILVARAAVAPMLAMFRALTGTVASYRDGDFSFGLVWSRRDELGELVGAHNALGDTIRNQRLALVERELLLDTMIQNTPVAMLLFGPGQHIVYANLTARKLLGDGRRMEGFSLSELLDAAPTPMREAIESGGDGLFEITGGDEEELYYLARRTFRLNGKGHELFVLRRLTSELRRQEVRTWKKVIRVISHELNNSLAPIASLAHSGGELVARGQTERLEKVFATIAERAKHLETFIRGYARFAKLPAPRLEKVEWPDFISGLRSQIDFSIDGELPTRSGKFDRPQLEQAVVNLLRNAHETGCGSDEISVAVKPRLGGVAIEVADRGPGMEETVMANALLPFYSTKRGGTGLGLALVREIAEAHDGRVSLANRVDGGLIVSVVLPADR